MVFNNIIPAWTLGDFDKSYNLMKENLITITEFYNRIKDLPEVPGLVKDNWKKLGEESKYYSLKDSIK